MSKFAVNVILKVLGGPADMIGNLWSNAENDDDVFSRRLLQGGVAAGDRGKGGGTSTTSEHCSLHPFSCIRRKTDALSVFLSAWSKCANHWVAVPYNNFVKVRKIS